MGYLKKLYTNFQENKKILCAFIGFISLNLLGNTIPIWFILLINSIEKGICFSVVIESIDQPFTFLVLGGSLLSMTLFLWQQDYTNEKSSREISTTMLIFILISLPLFGYLFYQTYNLSPKDVSKGHRVASYIISLIVFLYFLKYQYKDFEKNWILKNESTPKKQQEFREKSFNHLEESFDNFKDDE